MLRISGLRELTPVLPTGAPELATVAHAKGLEWPFACAPAPKGASHLLVQRSKAPKGLCDVAKAVGFCSLVSTGVLQSSTPVRTSHRCSRREHLCSLAPKSRRLFGAGVSTGPKALCERPRAKPNRLCPWSTGVGDSRLPHLCDVALRKSRRLLRNAP